MNRPSPPPEAAKLLEAALDVFVYAPIGFLLDARDVVPKLAERGRGQVTLARMFGRYAIQLGQAEADRVLHRQREGERTSEPTTADAATRAADDVAARSTFVAEPTDAARATGETDAVDAVDATDAPVARASAPSEVGPSEAEAAPATLEPMVAAKPAAKRASTRSTSTSTSTSESTAPRSSKPRAADLPIPGYDTLSASQVVPRLDALLPNELEAVRAYETAHRGRRTILNRIAQRLA